MGHHQSSMPGSLDGTPHGNRVEGQCARRVFFPEQTGINFIILLFPGLIKQAATQWAPPTAFQEELIGPLEPVIDH